jgi:hypothetical protein
MKAAVFPMRLLLTLTVLAFALPIPAKPTWVLLGERTVSDRMDHDTVVVTGARGDFSAVKIAVKRHAVQFHRVVVHFANGTSQELELREVIPARGESRVLDLTGTDRVIRSIDFWYDAQTFKGKKALVRIFGRR